MSDVAEITAERLRGFSADLDENVIGEVSASAEMVHRLGATTLELCELASVPGVKTIEYGGCPPVQILDLQPEQVRDQHAATVIWLPMARGFDQAELHRAARLKLLLPDERIIIVANPDHWWKASGILSREQRARVRDGDVRPVIGTVFHYLKEMNLTRVNHVGNSYGAKLAAAAAALAVQHGIHEVPRLVTIEPPDSVSRNFRDLALTFYETRHGVQDHKETMTDRGLINALHQEKRLWPYIGTLASLTNLAITQALTRGLFKDNVSTVLAHSPGTEVTVAWGTGSELVPHEHMTHLVEELQISHGDRVRSIVLEKLRHAMYYDIDLVAALIMQGLRAAPKEDVGVALLDRDTVLN